jgi:murein tripeptide amidase MpaA
MPILALIAGAAACASAQPMALPDMPSIDLMEYAQPRVYEGQAVIRVRTTSEAQLEALLQLVDSVWSERTGVGLLDVQLHRNHFDAVTDLGIGFDVLIEDLQARHDARWIQMRNLHQADQARNRGAGAHDDAWFTNYKQFSEIITYFNAIAAAHPDIASLSDVGDSLQGNDVYALTLTGPDAPGNLAADRPVVLWNGGQHAREWLSPMTVSYIASKLADDFGSDSRVTEMINNTRIVIVPVMNPDGYLYTWSNERFWRKNRRNNGDGTFGVDLNRNWGYEWGGEGASPFSSDDTYHGPQAFSEPETQVMRDLAMSFGDSLVSHIDFHTYSQLILWPFGYAEGVQTPEPDRTFFDELSTALSDEIQAFSGVFYNPIQSVDLYPAAGTCSDWHYGDLGAKSLTFELRPASGAGFDGFDPPPSIILPTAQENYEAAKLFVERTTLPVSLGVDAPDTVASDSPAAVTLTVSDIIDSHVPSSVTMRVRIGSSGSYTDIPMNVVSDNAYSADLPGAPCDSVIEFSFQVDTASGDTISFPNSGVLSALAQDFQVSFEDDMEIDTGWVIGQASDSATTGIWNRMDPEGTDAQPENDHTPGSGTDCWVTDGLSGATLGDRDIDGGATTLMSPLLDAVSLGEDAELVYWRWYSNDAGASPNNDSMTIEISNDVGNSWTTLEVVSENANQWVEARFRIADFVEPTDMIRVRFIASDLGDGSIVEAGVDDLRIESVGCSSNPADLNNDGILDFFDVSQFLKAYNASDPIADFNGDGIINFFDVSSFLGYFNQG